MIFHSYVSLPEGISHLSDLLPPPYTSMVAPWAPWLWTSPGCTEPTRRSPIPSPAIAASEQKNATTFFGDFCCLFWLVEIKLLISLMFFDALWISLNYVNCALSMVCSWIKSRWRFWTSTPHMFCWCLHTEYTDTQLLGVESETSWLNC